MIEQLAWLAICIYFEAQGEPFEGKVAVAHVILNRAEQREISVVEAVHRKGQFSWLWDDIPDEIKDFNMFVECSEAAWKAMQDRLMGETLNGANHYHATYVDPYWNKDMEKIAQIGKHIFYKGS